MIVKHFYWNESKMYDTIYIYMCLPYFVSTELDKQTAVKIKN